MLVKMPRCVFAKLGKALPRLAAAQDPAVFRRIEGVMRCWTIYLRNGGRNSG